jgi:hypothetical protein
MRSFAPWHFQQLCSSKGLASFFQKARASGVVGSAPASVMEKANQLRPMIGVVKVTLMKRLDVIQPVGLF